MSNKVNIVEWDKVDETEIKDILEWLDSDTDFYMRFLMWKHVRDNVEVVEEEEN
jgi:hypothetical protein